MRKTLPAELIDIDPYLRPIIHMSPFSGKLGTTYEGKALNERTLLAKSARTLTGRKMPIMLTCNGREALNRALAATVKSRRDLVSIITPSNCGYVSGCVTKEIEKFCRWTFGVAADATVALLVHEFGRYVSLPLAYKNAGIPVIEDCAYAMLDHRISPQFGVQGDFIVYSLAKAMPLQYGGLLITRDSKIKHRSSDLSVVGRGYLVSELHRHIGNLAQYNRDRAFVYKRMKKVAARVNLKESRAARGKDFAHAFLVALDGQANHENIKAYMNAQGVESSVFYGGNAYFLPCHPFMTDAEIDYIFAHMRRACDRFSG